MDHILLGCHLHTVKIKHHFRFAVRPVSRLSPVALRIYFVPKKWQNESIEKQT